MLALWGQPATLASGRDLVPSVTFGPFSDEDLTDDEARVLHYVNQDRLVPVIESCRPAMIVLTDVDRTFFNFPGSLSSKRADPRRIKRAIAANYTKVTSNRRPARQRPDQRRRLRAERPRRAAGAWPASRRRIRPGGRRRTSACP